MNIHPREYEPQSKYEFHLKAIFNNIFAKKFFAEEASKIIFEAKFGQGEEHPDVTLLKMKKMAYFAYLSI